MTSIIDAALVPLLPSLVLSRLERGSTLEHRDSERPLRPAGVGVLAGSGLLLGIAVARGARPRWERGPAARGNGPMMDIIYGR